MGRSGKSQQRPNELSSRHVSFEDFVRARDTVVSGLACIQSSIQQLQNAYIAHTNNVMAQGSTSPLELFKVTAPLLTENSLFGHRFGTSDPVPEPPPDKKKPRSHDKNAPKRPLTPYLLYMQTARAQIASELGPDHSAKDVADEGTRRWRGMRPKEREYWSRQYGANFARYKMVVKAYKAGMPIPEISDTEARRLYEEEENHGFIVEQSNSRDEIDRPEDALDSERSVSPSSEQSQEPLKVRSPPRSSKRRKSEKDHRVKRLSHVTQLPMREVNPDSSEVASPKLEPEKNNKRILRKREKEDGDVTLDSRDPVSEIVGLSKQFSDNTSKSKRSKRKRRSDVLDAEEM